jgi:hypothetical protein
MEEKKTRMSNVEQGISNDEVKSLLLFPSAFVIRYSIFCGLAASGGFAFERPRSLWKSQRLSV